MRTREFLGGAMLLWLVGGSSSHDDDELRSLRQPITMAGSDLCDKGEGPSKCAYLPPVSELTRFNLDGTESNLEYVGAKS